MSEPKHIRFEPPPRNCSGLPAWSVLNKKEGSFLGLIEWYSAWKQYILSTVAPGVVFSADCLRDIAHFCEQKTKEAKLDHIAETVRTGCAKES